MRNMARFTGLDAAGLNINDVRQIIKMDIEASKELQARIDQFRHDITLGRQPPEEEIDAMDSASKDMTKDLVRLIEMIENQPRSTPADREVLQALSARLAVSDKQSMKLAELRDLTRGSIDSRQPSVVDAEDDELELPLGGRPRTPSTTPFYQAPMNPQPKSAEDARAMSPGPILDSIDGKGPSTFRRDSPRFEDSQSRRASPRFDDNLSRPPLPGSRSSPKSVGTSRRPLDYHWSLPSPQGQSPSSQLPRNLPRTNSISAEYIPPPPPPPPSHLDGSFYRRPSPSSRFPRTVPNTTRASVDYARPTEIPQMSFRPGQGNGFFAQPPSLSTSFESVDTPLSPPVGRVNQSPEPCYEDYYDVNYIDGDLEDIEPDKSSWPLLYRMLDVDPTTLPDLFESTARR